MHIPVIEQQKAVKIPDAFRGMPDHMTLTSRDMAALLGISRQNVEKRLQLGQIPKPDRRATKSNFGNPKNLWTLGAIRAWLRGLKSCA